MSEQETYTLEQVREECKGMEIGEERTFKLSQPLKGNEISQLTADVTRDRDVATKGAVTFVSDGTQLHAKVFVPK